MPTGRCPISDVLKASECFLANLSVLSDEAVPARMSSIGNELKMSIKGRRSAEETRYFWRLMWEDD